MVEERVGLAVVEPWGPDKNRIRSVEYHAPATSSIDGLGYWATRPNLEGLRPAPGHIQELLGAIGRDDAEGGARHSSGVGREADRFSRRAVAVLRGDGEAAGAVERIQVGKKKGAPWGAPYLHRGGLS